MTDPKETVLSTTEKQRAYKQACELIAEWQRKQRAAACSTREYMTVADALRDRGIVIGQRAYDHETNQVNQVRESAHDEARAAYLRVLAFLAIHGVKFDEVDAISW
jgi:hypothetical protein